MGELFDKREVLREVISALKNDIEPEKILARDLDDFPNPIKISGKYRSSGFIPDLAVIYEESIDVYEIETDGNNNLKKWQVMQSYATKCNGNLYLVVPEHVLDNVKNVLANYKIDAGLLYFQARIT